ncbi:4193_t:CDS:2, partial [Funneliformis geosporum]
FSMRENEVSKANWKRIISAYLTGTKQTIISIQLNIPTSTVSDIIKKYRETGSTKPKERDITDKFNISLNTTLHSNIVRSYLHDEGLRSYTELIEVVQDKWRKITIETCHRLILSMPNRVKAVIKVK